MADAEALITALQLKLFDFKAAGFQSCHNLIPIHLFTILNYERTVW